jgi:hypothetical protein
MNWQSKTERIKLILCCLCILAVVALVVSSSSVSSGAQSNEGPAAAADKAENQVNATPAAETPAETTTAPAPSHPALAPAPAPVAPAQPALQDAAAAKVEGCVACHGGIEPMHRKKGTKPEDSGKLEDGKDGQALTCTYCHGGNPVSLEKKEAHVKPRYPDLWERYKKQDTNSSANPENSGALLANESYEFVRFVNPGDLRVAGQTCAACHSLETHANHNSLMRTGSMLWGAALYNNGMNPMKDSNFGESYSAANGVPERVLQVPRDIPGTKIYEPNVYNMWAKGILPYIDPLPRWEISQPGNTLRVFERGGKRRLEVGNPDKDEDPGKPDKGLSARGFGTQQRTDPVFLGLQKTRLLDPTMNFLGTNDFPGDYRSSGCTACHVIYANDNSAINSSTFYAKYGHDGQPGENLAKNSNFDRANDPASARDLSKESGHPIRHQLTQRMPTSQCMVCHMHPGNNMETTYTGFIWWDNETDGDKMYPQTQHNPSQDEMQLKGNRNAEGSSFRGQWSSISSPNGKTPDGDDGYKFISKTGSKEFNEKMTRTQFADFHGHGWMFRAIFKRDKRGNFTDVDDKIIPESQVSGKELYESINFRDNDNYELKSDGPSTGKPVHLKDIHLEKGMHCVDCHFAQDSHGNGNLYNEPRAAVEITCADCHGTTTKRADLLSSGPAAETSGEKGRDLTGIDTSDGVKIFEGRTPEQGKTLAGGNGVFARRSNLGRIRDKADPFNKGKRIALQPGEIIQNSMVEPGVWWRVKQTVDTVTKDSKDYNWKSEYAKTMRLNPNKPDDPLEWGGGANNDENKLAHSDNKVSCFTCHSAWMTSCFGCHLSMSANRKMPNRHSEGVEAGNSRNFTTYNYQVIRDDVFMLGRDGTAASHRADGFNARISPVASRSAVVVSSQNQNREWIYSQQQTISAEGFAGQAFNTHVPHTVRAKETKDCEDCHLAENNDNNAWLAQTYLQGTNYVNFVGRYLYVAGEEALEVFPVTEHEEPQAVKGSSLHKIAYPTFYDKFVKGGREVKTFYEHVGNPEVLQVQTRGEYAYVAAGKGGLRIYDIAQIDHKGFSERITTAPVSRFGQKFWVVTKDAKAIASPSTLANDPLRNRLMRNKEGNQAWVPSPYIYTVAAGGAPPTNGFASYLQNYKEYLALPAEQRQKTPNPLVNEEQLISPVYAFIYVADAEEGLVLVGAGTLLDGDPLNNYLSRAPIKGEADAAWNPNGILNGANNIITAGNYAYITTETKLVIVDLSKVNPFGESELSVVKSFDLKHPKAVAVQFRYAFVVDEEGMKVIDVTIPEQARMVEGAETPLKHAHSIYLARTNAYIADGPEGVAIVDITNPEKPGAAQHYNHEGKINDAHDVKIAMTNATLFAYVADGKNGVHILELMSPEMDAKYGGFSPKIDVSKIHVVAHMHTKGPALNISKGLDRDRASDESGNQVSVFGRRGARPLNLEEQRKMYLVRGTGKTFRVQNIGGLDKPPTAAGGGVTASNGAWQRLTTWFGGLAGLMVIAGLGWRRRRRKA